MNTTRPLFVAGLSGLLVLGLAAPGFSSSIRGVGVQEMLRESELVFEGRATTHEPAFFTPEGGIRSCVLFEVIDVIKGEPPTNPLRLCFAGGSVGATRMEVSDLEIPGEGEHGIYFVESVEKRLVNPIFGWDQGRFRIEPVPNGSAKRSGKPRNGVLTARGRPVLDLAGFEFPRRIATLLSTGSAAGVREGNPEEPEHALSPELFKEKLRALLEADPR